MFQEQGMRYTHRGDDAGSFYNTFFFAAEGWFMLHENRDIWRSLTAGLLLARKVDVAFMEEPSLKSPHAITQLSFCSD